MTAAPHVDVAMLTRRRVTDPAAISAAWAARRPGAMPADGRVMVVAADHPARGALAVRGLAGAMASRSDFLQRIATVLSRPGVDGILATADVLEDLLLLGLLDDRLVFGSMNRAGLQGATFELDDRFTAYDADTIAAQRIDGGKMLVRICYDDAGSVSTLEASGRAVTALSAHGLIAMVEPFITARRGPHRVENLLDPDSVITSVHVAAGLGASSARTWLKLPVVADMERVLDATTLPTLLLGGDPTAHQADTFASWRQALKAPSARGLVVGRALLYPTEGTIVDAVDAAVELVHGGL